MSSPVSIGRLAGRSPGANAARPLRRKRHSSTVTASMVAGPATTSTTSNGSCVKELPAGANRSDTFHTVVGHYLGCGWSVEQIDEHLRQYPDGIAGRYLGEGRLSREISRSASKYTDRALPLFDGWKAPEKIVETPPPEILEPISPEPETPAPDPDEDDIEDDLDELEEESRQDPKLPPLYSHGDTDPRPLKAWLIKRLMPAVGHGLLSGQWGAGKTFVLFDLAAALWTGQPFLGHPVKRQCGVLLIAAEGADEVRLRLEAVVRNKCGNMERAPFRWYETTPMLLQKGAVETLIAMAQQADRSLQQEFGLPLGLIVIDTVAACAGYTRAGDENDPAAAQAVMNVLKALAQALGCFVLGVDHFGKNAEAGTRGASSKEGASDLVLACLGDKSLSGSVSNTRLAVRKNRGGQQGQEFPFTLRVVEAPEPDDDGEPVTSMVVDWQPNTPGGNQTQPGPDPWAQTRRQDQRAAVLRLKRVMMSAMAEHGVEREIRGRSSGLDDRPGGGPRAVLCPDPGGRHAKTEGRRPACAIQTGAGLGRSPGADRQPRDRRRRVPAPL